MPLLEAGLTGGLGAQIRHRDKRPDNEHLQEAARDARTAWPASAEHRHSLPDDEEVSNPASSIDEPAVVSSLGCLGIELFQRIHDVVEANDATVCRYPEPQRRSAGTIFSAAPSWW